MHLLIKAECDSLKVELLFSVFISGSQFHKHRLSHLRTIFRLGIDLRKGPSSCVPSTQEIPPNSAPYSLLITIRTELSLLGSQRPLSVPWNFTLGLVTPFWRTCHPGLSLQFLFAVSPAPKTPTRHPASPVICQGGKSREETSRVVRTK